MSGAAALGPGWGLSVVDGLISSSARTLEASGCCGSLGVAFDSARSGVGVDLANGFVSGASLAEPGISPSSTSVLALTGVETLIGAVELLTVSASANDVKISDSLRRGGREGRRLRIEGLALAC